MALPKIIVVNLTQDQVSEALAHYVLNRRGIELCGAVEVRRSVTSMVRSGKEISTRLEITIPPDSVEVSIA